MNYSRTIPAILSATIALSSIALIPLTSPQIALALTADAVKTVAKEITVRIQGPKGGSGVILENKVAHTIFSQTGTLSIKPAITKL